MRERSAAASVFRYAKNKMIACFIEGKDTKCSLASRTDRAALFYIYSDSKPLPKYALAAIYYSPDTGNGVSLDAAIFQRASSHDYAFTRNVTGLFGDIDRVVLSGKALLVTTTTLTDHDAHCCPTGHTKWRINIATGVAHYLSGNRVGIE